MECNAVLLALRRRASEGWLGWRRSARGEAAREMRAPLYITLHYIGHTELSSPSDVVGYIYTLRQTRVAWSRGTSMQPAVDERARSLDAHAFSLREWRERDVLLAADFSSGDAILTSSRAFSSNMSRSCGLVFIT